MRELYGISIGGPDDHISPGRLRARLVKAGDATPVNCIASKPVGSWIESKQLASIYRDLINVTTKLRAYQYPHREGSFTDALADTFTKEGIAKEPKNYAIHTRDLRRVLTEPGFFRVHEFVWPSKYT